MPKWNLQEHGDAEERKWWLSVEAHFPYYEEFWREHVVPLTCREVNSSNIFMRPSVPAHLSDLGNTNYSVFWHLAGAHQHLCSPDWLPNLQRHLYGFYGHLVSAGQDRCYGFLKATKRVLEVYGSAPIADRQRRLGRYGDGDLHSHWQNILKAIKVYRRQLFHLRLFVVVGGMVPEREWLARYMDLRTIMEMLGSANRDQIIAEHFVDAENQCRSDLRELERVLNRIWAVALREFEEISDPRRYREDRSRIPEADRATCSVQWTRGIFRSYSTSGSIVTPSGVVMFGPNIDDPPRHQ